MSFRLLVIVVFCCLGFLVGCSGEKPSGPLGSVSGHLTIDGRTPKPGTNIVFMDAQLGTTAVGSTDETGAYSLKSFRKSGDSMEFPVGRFNVSIQVPEEDYLSEDEITAEMALEGITPGLQGKREFPEKYQNFATSGLSYDVVEGENTIDISLSSSE